MRKLKVASTTPYPKCTIAQYLRRLRKALTSMRRKRITYSSKMHV